MTNNTEELKNKIEQMVANLSDKNFTIYFFVIDTKGNPSGSLTYIYETALNLIELGYKVEMIHNDKDFVGVSGWLGEKYASIKHNYNDEDTIHIKACDFLIIPELFSNIMHETSKLPCKRIVLSQNFDFVTEFIPVGISWLDYKINDVITTTDMQKTLLEGVFPFANVSVINPSISNEFYSSIKPKKLVVGIIAKETKSVNKIAKEFYWKYPTMKWVSFVDLKGFPKEVFSEKLRETAIVVWVDESTYFGYSALEAMKSECFVIGKIPTIIPEWMMNEENNDLNMAGVWFDNMNDVHKLIASSVEAYINDEIPEEFVLDSTRIPLKYSLENQKSQTEKVFSDLISKRIEEFENIKKEIIKN